MVYQISGFNTKQGDDTDDATIRDFWSRSFGGIHLTAFNTGFAAGTADLAANSFAGHVALMAVEASIRDNDWSARLDGYNYATRTRGTNDERPSFDARFDPSQPIEIHGTKPHRRGPFSGFRAF